jgi:hypothetical protein
MTGREDEHGAMTNGDAAEVAIIIPLNRPTSMPEEPLFLGRLLRRTLRATEMTLFRPAVSP